MLVALLALAAASAAAAVDPPSTPPPVKTGPFALSCPMSSAEWSPSTFNACRTDPSLFDASYLHNPSNFANQDASAQRFGDAKGKHYDKLMDEWKKRQQTRARRSPDTDRDVHSASFHWVWPNGPDGAEATSSPVWPSARIPVHFGCNFNECERAFIAAVVSNFREETCVDLVEMTQADFDAGRVLRLRKCRTHDFKEYKPAADTYCFNGGDGWEETAGITDMRRGNKTSTLFITEELMRAVGVHPPHYNQELSRDSVFFAEAATEGDESFSYGSARNNRKLSEQDIRVINRLYNCTTTVTGKKIE